MTKVKNLVPGSPEWEALCSRCGLCCYEKYDYRGKIYYTPKPCPHLDVNNNLCKNYADRSRMHPDCAQLTPDIIEAGILPSNCPYVKGLEGYNAPVMPNCSPFTDHE